MDIGEAITFGGVYVSAMVVIWVWVGLTCEVKVATEPTGFWSVVWVGELDMLGRLQAEIMATSKRDIGRSLKIFNFAFMIAMKIYSRQFVFVPLSYAKHSPAASIDRGVFLSATWWIYIFSENVEVSSSRKTLSNSFGNLAVC